MTETAKFYRSYTDYFIYGGALVLFGGLLYLLTTVKLDVLREPWLGGAMNTAFFGVPVYLFAGLALVILAIVIEGGMWWFYWKPFEYMHGLYRAYWDKINAVFIGDLMNRYQLIPENRAKLVHLHEDYEKLYDAFFRKKDPLTRMSVWLGRKFGRNYDMMIAKDLEPGVQESPVVQAGVIPVDMIFDFDQWVYTNTPQRREMIALTDKWNEANPDDEIYTIAKFQRYFIAGKFKEIPYDTSILKPTVKISWSRIKSAFPPEENEAAYAGYERQLAEDMDRAEETDLKKYMWAVIGMTILFAIMMMGLRMMHIIGHAPA